MKSPAWINKTKDGQWHWSCKVCPRKADGKRPGGFHRDHAGAVEQWSLHAASERHIECAACSTCQDPGVRCDEHGATPEAIAAFEDRQQLKAKRAREAEDHRRIMDRMFPKPDR